MKNIPLENTPEYDTLVKEIVNGSEKKVKTRDEILREFDREKWCDLFLKMKKKSVLNVNDVIFAENNSGKTVGIAPNCNLAGIRHIGSDPVGRVPKSSILNDFDSIDIYNNSWGPWDDGDRVDVGKFEVMHPCQNGTTLIDVNLIIDVN